MISGVLLLRRVPAVLALVSTCTLAQQVVEVSIQDYRFTPQEVRI